MYDKKNKKNCLTPLALVDNTSLEIF